MKELFSTAMDRSTALETENSSGYEVSARHRLPKREEGEDVVRQVSGLQEGPAREGGTQASLRQDLPQSQHPQVEGRADAQRDHS